MSYVSPIKIFYAEEPEEGWTDKIGKYLAGEVDNLVLQSCVKVGCHVDKDELEKALRYDRDQYVKGYEDGKRDAAAAAIEALQAQLPKRGKWVTHPEVKNIYGGVYIECPFCGEKYVVQNVSDEKFCRNCGADLRAKMEVQDEAD